MNSDISSKSQNNEPEMAVFGVNFPEYCPKIAKFSRSRLRRSRVPWTIFVGEARENKCIREQTRLAQFRFKRAQGALGLEFSKCFERTREHDIIFDWKNNVRLKRSRYCRQNTIKFKWFGFSSTKEKAQFLLKKHTQCLVRVIVISERSQNLERRQADLKSEHTRVACV